VLPLGMGIPRSPTGIALSALAISTSSCIKY
jgi:hypothetical protein